MDQELRTFLGERFNEMSRQLEARLLWETARLRKEMASFREEVRRHLSYQEETAQQTPMLIEEWSTAALLIVEAVMQLSQRVERYQKQTELSFQQIHSWIKPYFEELRRNHGDLNNSYQELLLNHDHLDSRVRILEERAERQRGDVMDGVRKIVERYRREDAERAATGQI